MIKYKREGEMKEKGRFLRLFAALFMLTFSANVFAAGYTCEKIYDTCNEGYYLSITIVSNVHRAVPAMVGPPHQFVR